MAKRKRLTPANPEFLQNSDEVGSQLEHKSMFPTDPASRPAAPITDMVGAAAATAALQEVSEALHRARAEGRMIEPLGLDTIDVAYLVRDRIVSLDEDMQVLKDSLMQRGQQVPIEVVDIGGGRYGLISGWRRFTAIQTLFEETGDERFATILALLRQPENSADAYLAMVEENEIRVGLSYYERARIAARAIKQGVYPTEKAALLELFRSASRAKRSKIRAFLPIVARFDGVLSFPASIGERLGLQFSKAIEDPETLQRIYTSLRETPPSTPVEEGALISKAMAAKNPKKKSLTSGLETISSGDVAVGLRYSTRRDGSFTLSGVRMNAELQARLLEWLKAQI